MRGFFLFDLCAQCLCQCEVQKNGESVESGLILSTLCEFDFDNLEYLSSGTILVI